MSPDAKLKIYVSSWSQLAGEMSAVSKKPSLYSQHKALRVPSNTGQENCQAVQTKIRRGNFGQSPLEPYSGVTLSSEI